LCHFIETVASSGIVTDFQIHARIAVLHNKNFSPADNRKIPPLKYQLVHRLVRDYPELTFTLNGGINTLNGVQQELEACPGLKGVMVGRAWAANPWSFAMADPLLYSTKSSNSDANSTIRTTNSPLATKFVKPKNRFEILQEYGRHADAEEAMWDPVKIRRFIIKAISPLFAGEPNSKRYRIALDEIAARPKILASQGKSYKTSSTSSSSSASSEPPLSELIMNAALQHLSQEVLLKTPEDTYYEKLSMDESQILEEWQRARKAETL